MKKYLVSFFVTLMIFSLAVAGCGGKKADKNSSLQDGTYTATFSTDSSMFRVNETLNGEGKLTVKDGEMTMHITLQSQKIVNLFNGLAKDAQKALAALIEPSVDTVFYDDGTSEEVYGFDIKVPCLDEEFDLALIGTKGVWYDHKVSVSNPRALVNVTLEGGTGKSTVDSPATISIENGVMMATIQWSSKNYDYMIVNGEKYMNESAEGELSVFTIPVSELGVALPVIADTVAMSTPHEIEYTLLFELAE